MLDLSEALSTSYDEVGYLDFTVISFRKALLRSVEYMKTVSIMGSLYLSGKVKRKRNGLL